MKQPPDKFTITITEKDRLNAGPYISCSTCLIATAVKREGFWDVREHSGRMYIDGIWYKHDSGLPHDLSAKPSHEDHAVYYWPEVVGKQISFTRA